MAVNDERRVVARTELPDCKVSTVFLGLDHSFGKEGGPILFETMIFGGRNDGWQRRYKTWQQAEQGHVLACMHAQGEE